MDLEVWPLPVDENELVTLIQELIFQMAVIQAMLSLIVGSVVIAWINKALPWTLTKIRKWRDGDATTTTASTATPPAGPRGLPTGPRPEQQPPLRRDKGSPVILGLPFPKGPPPGVPAFFHPKAPGPRHRRGPTPETCVAKLIECGQNNHSLRGGRKATFTYITCLKCHLHVTWKRGGHPTAFQECPRLREQMIDHWIDIRNHQDFMDLEEEDSQEGE
jgi:hypothetical protein